MIEKIGIINADAENRDWGGSAVSADQPSIIDDLSIRSGFYGCQALAVVCTTKTMAQKVNGIGSAFVCAENMVLEAYDLGVSSCIVGRAADTFAHPEIAAELAKWNLGEEYVPIVFVCLGYIRGDYPKIKPRTEGRAVYISKE